MKTQPALDRISAVPDGLKRLASALEKAKNDSFFYKRLFRKRLRDTVSEELVKENFLLLPFTSKEDVIRNYPDGFLSTDIKNVVLYCESTGTSGNTIGSTKSASFYTKSDLARDAECRFSPDLKLTSEDIVANTLPFALTSSGICFDMSARQSGAAVINLDSGSLLSSPRKHVEIITALKASVLICSQPFLYSTLLTLDGHDVRNVFSSLRAIQLCGLASLPKTKIKIAKIFGVPVFDTYGLSEFGATTFTCQQGHMHVHEDDFLIEIIDPRTGDNVESGVGGEIVITTLNRQGSPKVRYRTADFGILEYETCSCGRHSPRLTVKGRLRDAAQFGQRFRLPIDFEEVINEFPETTGLYRLYYKPLENNDATVLSTENVVQARVVVDSDNISEELKQRIESRLHEEFGPYVTVELVKPGSATPGLFNQDIYSSVRTIKSATFDDGRPTEWLVTY